MSDRLKMLGGDAPARLGHAGGVGRGEIVPVFDRDFPFYLYFSSVLAVQLQRERVVVHGAHFRSPQG